MLIAWWWALALYLIGIATGVLVGIVNERIRQSEKRREEIVRRLDYDSRRWNVVKGGSNMFERFTGHCPKCGGTCEEIDSNYFGSFINVALVCLKCDYEFWCLYDNGKILKNQ